MAVYNGENYLRKQLESIINQSVQSWVLIIRDDGSTDDSIKIIKYYKNRDNRIYLHKDSKGRIGPAKSFLAMTQLVTTEYFMFCDQDDIWFAEKIEKLLNAAKKSFDKSIPCLVHSTCLLYRSPQKKFIDNKYAILASDLKGFLFLNGGYQGASCLYNNKMAKMLSQYNGKKIYMHDDIASLTAHVFGLVFFVEEPLMLYRQHDKNVTGNVQHGIKAALSLIKRFIQRKTAVLTQEHYFERIEFFSKYRSEMDIEVEKLFDIYKKFPYRPIFSRLWSLYISDCSYGGKKWKLFLKTLFWKPIG